MGIDVRLLGPADLDAFRRVRLEALRREPACYASSAADWERQDEKAWRARMAAGPIAAAFRAGEPVAVMGLVPQQGSRVAHRATLVMAYVRDDARGRGLAERMLALLLDVARARGLWQVELHVSAENPAAVRFYRRAGFAEVGRMPADFVHEGREIDGLLMVRRLAA
jgi:ribosomal protein S18 acetylase RimI-like enzyme